MAEGLLDDHVAVNKGVLSDIRPNLKRAKLAETLIWVVLVFELISVFTGYQQLELLLNVKNGRTVTMQEASANDMRVLIVSVLSLIVAIISWVTYIQWFRRAYYNLNLRTTCHYTEGWAAGSWFVPIISLYRPYEIMCEIWDKTTEQITNKWGDVPMPAKRWVIGLWWTLWIINGIIGSLFTRWALKQETLDHLILGTRVEIITSLLVFPIAYLAVRVIRNVSKREEQLRELEAYGIPATELNATQS